MMELLWFVFFMFCFIVVPVFFLGAALLTVLYLTLSDLTHKAIRKVKR